MKKRLIYFLCSIIFAVAGLFFAPQDAFAVPPDTSPTPIVVTPDQPTDTETTPQDEEEGITTDSTCYDQVGGIGWLICPVTGTLAKAIDSVYKIIESFLKVNPISTDQDSPIYLVWEYIRNITNVIFIIFLLIVIYSQLTGFGINNYGIKKVLPRIIIAALLVNLSYIICALAVDISNILGSSLGAVFTGIYENVATSSTVTYSFGDIAGSILGTVAVGTGVTIAGLAIVGGLGAALWMLVPVIFAGIISVVVALVTMAARQALIVILIMIAPLAFVAYLLPNTEKWFKKWKDILLQMLIFYPMFAVLFSGSQLASWVIISSATNVFGVILGLAVQVLPLFFALSLMKMSNTILGSISSGIQKLTAPAQKGIGTWADSRRTASKARHLAANRTPSARLSNYLAYRKTLRETDTKTAETIAESRATIRAQRKISGGFDADKTWKKPRVNRYTRRASTAKTLAANASTAVSDTSNILGSYNSHFGTGLDYKALEKIEREGKKMDKDDALGYKSAKAYLHASRTAFTAESNEEADWGFLMSTYTDAAAGGVDSYNYRRWLKSSAGELGLEKGISSVLGQIIARADKAEQRRRGYDRILLNKYSHNKRAFRNMFVGYYVDDDGWATDKNGERLILRDERGLPVLDENGRKQNLELVQGELLWKDPSKLVRYDTIDPNSGKRYYDWKDQKGNFLMRVYQDDVPYIKEALSNDDVPINDPINSLYAILAGIYPDDPARSGYSEDIKGIGIAPFSTTLGRALQAANYKEKTAGMGAQAVASISRRQIQNPAHLLIEFLDNIKKTGKASNFNTQDAIHIDYFAAILDEKNWPRLFPEDAIRSFVNVNGEHIKGLDADGNDVDYETATYDDLLRRIKDKYLFPVVDKFSDLVQRVTQGTIDNQKPGAGESLTRLISALDNSWTGQEAVDAGRINVARKDKPDFLLKVREMRTRLNRSHAQGGALQDLIHETFNGINEASEIVAIFQNQLGDDPVYREFLEGLDEYMIFNPDATEQQLYEEVEDLLQRFNNS